MITPRQLKALYQQGQNISALLRQEIGASVNTEEIIEIAYDLQAGSYIAAIQDPVKAKQKSEYTSEIAKTILSLCRPVSLLEAGVGEATTLSGVVKNLGIPNLETYGFDLSWSRVSYGFSWLQSEKVSNATLCTGSLFQIPFADNSIDLVYTSHSIEPNGGNEEPVLRELYRVTREYLILLEPAYELASEEAKRRMESHGYCRNLKGTCEALGYRVSEYGLFPVTSNPLNPTGILIIKKNSTVDRPNHVLACPKFKTGLQEISGMLFSPEALTVYPILAGIPCLRKEYGIIAGLYPEVIAKGKRLS